MSKEHERNQMLAEALDGVGREQINTFTHNVNLMILEEWKERAERYEEALKSILGWPEFDVQDSGNPGKAIIDRIEQTAKEALEG